MTASSCPDPIYSPPCHFLFCVYFAGPQDAETQTDRSLNDLPPRLPLLKYKYVEVHPPPKVTYIPSDWKSTTDFLSERDHVAQSVESFRMELHHQIQRRLVQPRTQDLWQAPSFCMTNVPKAAATRLMKDMDVELDTALKTKWVCRSPEQMWKCCRGLAQVHKECMGQSKALGKGKRHPWHRAIATIIYFEATHVTRKKGGRLLLYVNALYVLMLETGELVRPRTAEKRPILMTEDEEARARHAILRDLKLMAMKGLDLSGKLLQMCGPKFAAQATSALEEEESLLTEAADRAERASMPDWRRDAMEAGENWDDEHAPDRLPSPPSCSESDAEEEEAEEEVSAQMAD